MNEALAIGAAVWCVVMAWLLWRAVYGSCIRCGRRSAAMRMCCRRCRAEIGL